MPFSEWINKVAGLLTGLGFDLKSCHLYRDAYSLWDVGMSPSEFADEVMEVELK